MRERLSRAAVRIVRTKVVDSRATAPLVSVTFDDALDTAFTRGAAILEEQGARGTFYVSGGLIGAAHPDRTFMTADQVVALHRRGHEIACHTFSHPRVATLSDRRLREEAERNRAALAGLDDTIRPVNFAYPYNAASLRSKRTVQRFYASCRGGVPGLNRGRIDLGYLRAVELCDELIDLARVGAWIAETVRRRAWLVFLTHGVTEDAQAWRSTPALFEGAVRLARASGCEIVTVREALERIGAPPIEVPHAP